MVQRETARCHFSAHFSPSIERAISKQWKIPPCRCQALLPEARSRRRRPPFPDPLARCGRPRLTKLTAPIVFTMAPEPRWRLVMVIAVLGLAELGVVRRICLSSRVRGGSIADASTPDGCREWAQKDRPELWRCPVGQFGPNVHNERRLEREIHLTLASRHSGAAKTAPISANTSAPPHSALGSGAAVPIATAPAAPPPAIASPGLQAASVPRPASVPVPALPSWGRRDPDDHHPLRQVRANR